MALANDTTIMIPATPATESADERTIASVRAATAYRLTQLGVLLGKIVGRVVNGTANPVRAEPHRDQDRDDHKEVDDAANHTASIGSRAPGLDASI
jgi:hypothetical protein